MLQQDSMVSSQACAGGSHRPAVQSLVISASLSFRQLWPRSENHQPRSQMNCSSPGAPFSVKGGAIPSVSNEPSALLRACGVRPHRLKEQGDMLCPLRHFSECGCMSVGIKYDYPTLKPPFTAMRWIGLGLVVCPLGDL